MRRIVPRGTKYQNVKTAGYSSRKEARRAQELKLEEKAGSICELKEQVKYELIPKQDGERACNYIADFVYSRESGRWTVEDCKGLKTREYIIKRKLMLFVHNISWQPTAQRQKILFVHNIRVLET